MTKYIKKQDSLQLSVVEQSNSRFLKEFLKKCLQLSKIQGGGGGSAYVWKPP